MVRVRWIESVIPAPPLFFYEALAAGCFGRAAAPAPALPVCVAVTFKAWLNTQYTFCNTIHRSLIVLPCRTQARGLALLGWASCPHLDNLPTPDGLPVTYDMDHRKHDPPNGGGGGGGGGLSSLVAFASFAVRNEDISAPMQQSLHPSPPPPVAQAAPFLPQPPSPPPSNGKRRRRQISPMSSNYVGGGGGGRVPLHNSSPPSLPLPPNHLYYPPPPSSVGGESSAFDSRSSSSYGSYGTTTSSSSNNPRLEALVHSLSTPARRRFAMADFFYSTVDRAYFNQNEFQEDLDALGLSHVQTLTRTEWSRVRVLLGRRRRVSPAFFRQERRRLEEYRQVVRDVQQGVIVEPSPGMFIV